MSTNSTSQQAVRLQVLWDKKSGRVLAAGPSKAMAMGDDAPQEFMLIPGEGEVSEEIELTDDQALMRPPDLFASHVVRNGRLVRTDKAK